MEIFSPDSCVPAQPASITGNTYPDCNQLGLTYSIAEVAWAQVVITGQPLLMLQ